MADIYLVWSPDERVVSAPLLHHIANQMFLSVVRRQTRNALSGVAMQTHVHEDGHHVLGLSQILKEECTPVNVKGLFSKTL